MPKILYLDIETAPVLAYVWRLFKENVGLNQIKENERLLSFSAVWDDSDDVIYDEARGKSDTRLVRKLIKLFDEADVIIGHNVQSFDRNTINSRAVILGVNPPSPYKIIDTYRVAKQEFNFKSNSLAYLCKTFHVDHGKKTHAKFPGFELWAACLTGNEEAWEEMKIYNIYDTLAVREVYLRMRPWIRNHANLAVMIESDELVCPKCGSHNIQRRGYTTTTTGKYQKFVCNDCHGWARTRFSEYPKEKAKNLLVNAV